MQNHFYAEQINIREDYTHSSNSLFHFMKYPQYLYSAIKCKALMPRYCVENIEYLKLASDGKPFNNMAVLMKCFCDIPLHKITQDFECLIQKNISIDVDSPPRCAYNHTKLYGEYALSFSKSWGEKRGIQPISYLNINSPYFFEFREAIEYALTGKEQISDSIIAHYLRQLAFSKPLRGSMPRKDVDGEIINNIEKNFHDEREWRFVPESSFKDFDAKYESVIAAPSLLGPKQHFNGGTIEMMSKELCEVKNAEYWLKFDYNDIRYIIVPNKQARLEFIDFIMNTSDSEFSSHIEKQILISKVLVLDEIRKDW